MYVTSTLGILAVVLYILSFFYDVFDLIRYSWFHHMDVDGVFPPYSDENEDSDDDDIVDDNNIEVMGLDNSVISTLPRYEVKIVIDGDDDDDDVGDGRCTVASVGSLGSDECVVCLTGVEEGEIVRVLPNCKHMFHVDCIDRWLGSSPTCPMCRRTVEPPSPTTTVDKVTIMEVIVKHDAVD